MERNAKMEAIAIYFPSWHANPHYESWYGSGFSEWELVKTAKPLFPGHHQPKVPEWGYFDESDPMWAAKEIDLAADHGITVFLYDWYWYNGVQIMEEGLEKGFLRAPNRHRLKFALMWANHDWGGWPAITGKPGMFYAGDNRGAEIWLPSRHSMEDLDKVIDYCCERYFNEPNYWRIEGEPVFAIYNNESLVKQLGGEVQAQRGIERMQNRVSQNGFPGLRLLTNVAGGNEILSCHWSAVPSLRQMGFDGVFAYNIVRSANYTSIPETMPIYPYEEMMATHRYCWARIAEGGLPHIPVVTVGCDVSPRWHRSVTFPMEFRKLGYEPIAVDNTPERFGELCRSAVAAAKKQSGPFNAILINAWNEWTEGMFLLPEKQYGTGYLTALREALESARSARDVG